MEIVHDDTVGDFDDDNIFQFSEEERIQILAEYLNPISYGESVSKINAKVEKRYLQFCSSMRIENPFPLTE